MNSVRQLNPIEGNINRILKHRWQDLTVYVYKFGVMSLGEFLPGYTPAPELSYGSFISFVSVRDPQGIRLSLNSDREIVIVGYGGKSLVSVGFFCEPKQFPGTFCDNYCLEKGLYS